jgi:hypothetical protein
MQMEHATVMARPGEQMTEEDALAASRSGDILGAVFRWRDGFIPALRRVVAAGA